MCYKNGHERTKVHLDGRACFSEEQSGTFDANGLAWRKRKLNSCRGSFIWKEMFKEMKSQTRQQHNATWGVLNSADSSSGSVFSSSDCTMLALLYIYIYINILK